MRLDGVINFDARIGCDGHVWMIECNPRFFFSMDAIMVAGLNFVEIGSKGALDANREVRLPRATLKDLFRLRVPERGDLKMLAHWLGDPLMFAYAVAGKGR